jgi:hypothetical protein
MLLYSLSPPVCLHDVLRENFDCTLLSYIEASYCVPCYSIYVLKLSVVLLIFIRLYYIILTNCTGDKQIYIVLFYSHHVCGSKKHRVLQPDVIIFLFKNLVLSEYADIWLQYPVLACTTYLTTVSIYISTVKLTEEKPG